MKPSEVMRLFETYHRLLAVLEPHEAILWLIRPQPELDHRCPCQLLGAPGYEDVVNLIKKLRDNAQ